MSARYARDRLPHFHEVLAKFAGNLAVAVSLRGNENVQHPVLNSPQVSEQSVWVDRFGHAGRYHGTVRLLISKPSNPLTNGNEVWKGEKDGKAVAYYLVSIRKQEESRLGLDAQQLAVEALCRARGLELIAPPFQDVESGKNSERPA